MNATETETREAFEEVREEDMEFASYVETRETIEDFAHAAKNYRECSPIQQGITASGLPWLHIEECQVAKGQERASLTVIDFGDVRLVYR